MRDTSRTKPSEVSEESGFGIRKLQQNNNGAMAQSLWLRNMGKALCHTPYAEAKFFGLCTLGVGLHEDTATDTEFYGLAWGYCH